MLFDRLIEIQNEINITIQKINFSGALSAKRRERLTDSVFEIDDMLGGAYTQTNPMKPSQTIAENRRKSYEDIKK